MAGAEEVVAGIERRDGVEYSGLVLNEEGYRRLAATPLDAQAERRRPAVDSGEYPPRFRLSLGRKDAELVQAAAAEAGLELPALEAARAHLAAAEAAGLGDEDYSAVLKHIVG